MIGRCHIPSKMLPEHWCSASTLSAQCHFKTLTTPWGPTSDLEGTCGTLVEQDKSEGRRAATLFAAARINEWLFQKWNSDSRNYVKISKHFLFKNMVLNLIGCFLLFPTKLFYYQVLSLFYSQGLGGVHTNSLIILRDHGNTKFESLCFENPCSE